MNEPDELTVEIAEVLSTPSGSGILLKHSSKHIAIFVDEHVGCSISMFLHGLAKNRPLTHDLLGLIIHGLGARVTKVVINDLKEQTYFARIHIAQENEIGRHMLEIDARPSDSIALALQQKAPIFVHRSVWDKVQDMTWMLSSHKLDDPSAEFPKSFSVFPGVAGLHAADASEPEGDEADDDEDDIDLTLEDLEKLLLSDDDYDPEEMELSGDYEEFEIPNDDGATFDIESGKAILSWEKWDSDEIDKEIAAEAARLAAEESEEDDEITEDRGEDDPPPPGGDRKPLR